MPDMGMFSRNGKIESAILYRERKENQSEERVAGCPQPMVENSISTGGNDAGQSETSGRFRSFPDITETEAGKDHKGSDGLEGGCIKVKNETDIPNKLIAAIVRFARPPGIRKFEVVVKNYKGRGIYRGHGGRRGITIRIDAKAKFPRDLYVYQYGQLKQKWTKPDKRGYAHRLKGRRYYLASLTEALIYLVAHELMHTKQGQRGNVRGRVWGARGRFSEIETESYAIRKLRDYRQSK